MGTREHYTCSRYDGGYPIILSRDQRFAGHDANRTFTFLPCSGLTSAQILDQQVPLLPDGSLDVITVSAGGNDAHMGDVLDSCVFEWRLSSEEKCEAALARSRVFIDTDLDRNLDALLAALKTKLILGDDGGNNDGGAAAASGPRRIYVPGYSPFWGLSQQCDDISWAVWGSELAGGRLNLTRERRRRMNELVGMVNSKIGQAVERAGERVVFVDWGWTFEELGGRFCEEGVVEPAPARDGLLFFEWNTLDPGEDPDIIQKPGGPVVKGTWEGFIAERLLETLDERTDAEIGVIGANFHHTFDYLEWRKWNDERGYRIEMGFDDLIFWFLPDSWKRVFHPRALGQHIIANMVLRAMALQRARYTGVGMLDEDTLVSDHFSLEL